MICPRCKGLGVMIDRRAFDPRICAEITVLAYQNCLWCDGSGTSNNADLAGAGIADGGRPAALPASIAARRLDLVEARP